MWKIPPISHYTEHGILFLIFSLRSSSQLIDLLVHCFNIPKLNKISSLRPFSELLQTNPMGSFSRWTEFNIARWADDCLFIRFYMKV